MIGCQTAVAKVVWLPEVTADEVYWYPTDSTRRRLSSRLLRAVRMIVAGSLDAFTHVVRSYVP